MLCVYIVYVKVSFFKCMSMCKCNVINLQLYNMWVIRKRTKEDEEEEKKVNQKANITIINNVARQSEKNLQNF